MRMSTPVSGSTQFKVTPEALTTASGSCTNTAGLIQNQLSALGNYVLGLEVAWQGTASAAFQELMIQFNYNAGLLNTALLEMADALTKSGLNYSNSDSTNTNNITAVGSGLSGGGTNFS
jgi:early secretory antigenic target protein ESAT-6